MMRPDRRQPGRAAGWTALIVALTLTFSLPAVHAAGFGQPSNPAGVWEMEIQQGTHLLSFPILPDGATVEQILGDNFPAGDTWENATRIVTVHEGELHGSYYSSIESAWTGDLETLQGNRGYWLIVPDGADPVTLQLIGAALPMAEAEVDTLYPGVNLVACPAVVPVTLAGSGLTDSGLISARFPAIADRVYAYDNNLLAPGWHDPVQGWSGANFTFHPERGYLVERASGNDPMVWIRPNLIVGAEPPRGGIRPTVPASLTPLLRAPEIDFSRPPWEERTSRQRSTGGAR